MKLGKPSRELQLLWALAAGRQVHDEQPDSADHDGETATLTAPSYAAAFSSDAEGF